MVKNNDKGFAARVQTCTGVALSALRATLDLAQEGSNAAGLVKEIVQRVCDGARDWREVLEIVAGIPRRGDHAARATCAIEIITEACKRKSVEALIEALTLKAERRLSDGYAFALRIAEAACTMYDLPKPTAKGLVTASRIGVAALTLAQFGYLQGEDPLVRARPRFLARWWRAHAKLARAVAKNVQREAEQGPWARLKVELTTLKGGMPPPPAPRAPLIETRKPSGTFPPVNVRWIGTDRRQPKAPLERAS